MPGPLGQALQAVSRAISARTTLPILNNILVSATDQGLVLTATNLEIGIRKLVPAEISEEGSTTVPARLLTDFVSTLPDQELSLDLDASTQTLGLRCARFDTHIKCIEAEEFPPSPRPDEGDRLEVPLDEMLRAVEQTQMAASTDEARPVLTGVLCQVKGVELTLAATDGHRLAVRKLRDSQAEIDAAVEGAEIQIAFNARYVLDALAVISDDKVELQFNGPLSPGLIRMPGKDDYVYVIMPVRVAM